MPVIIDAGNMDPQGNSAHLTIREHESYTGTRCDRARVRNDAGARSMQPIMVKTT